MQEQRTEQTSAIMTTAEVADYLRCSRTWVAQMVNCGRIPVIALGPEDKPKTARSAKMWRFRRVDVEHFVNQARFWHKPIERAGEGSVKSPAHLPPTPIKVEIPGWDGIRRMKLKNPGMIS